MIVFLKGFFQELGIFISKYSNFESTEFQSISATGKSSYWGSLRSAQSEGLDERRASPEFGALSAKKQ